ncbi:MAG: AbrB/MazE/SpoVT family DNA-binding domain-containing protein [Candidatus Nitrosocaldaceae archaeon]
MNGNEIENMLKRYAEAQSEFLKQVSSMQMSSMQSFISMLQVITQNSAIFKTNVQSNGRITIPEAEREALGINEGDLVQVIIIPLRSRSL